MEGFDKRGEKTPWCWQEAMQKRRTEHGMKEREGWRGRKCEKKESRALRRRVEKNMSEKNRVQRREKSFPLRMRGMKTQEEVMDRKEDRITNGMG